MVAPLHTVLALAHALALTGTLHCALTRCAFRRDQRLNFKSSVLVMRTVESPQAAQKQEDAKRTELEAQKLEMLSRAAM